MKNSKELWNSITKGNLKYDMRYEKTSKTGQIIFLHLIITFVVGMIDFFRSTQQKILMILLKISLVQTDKKKLSLVVQLSGPTSSGTVECKRT